MGRGHCDESKGLKRVAIETAKNYQASGDSTRCNRFKAGTHP